MQSCGRGANKTTTRLPEHKPLSGRRRRRDVHTTAQPPSTSSPHHHARTDDARRASIKRPFYMVVNKKNGSRHIIKAYLNCRAKKIIESKRDANATQRENRMINTLPCKPALDVV